MSAALQELLERYPWPADLAGNRPPLDYLWHYRVKASPTDLWPYLIDTSRINKALGVAPMEFEEENGILRGRSRFGGARHEWIEMPWDWLANRALVAVRVYQRGFASAVRAIYELTDAGDGTTDIAVYFGWIPKTLWGRIAVPLGMPAVGRNYGALFRDIERNLGTPMAEIPRFHDIAPALAADVRQRVAVLREQLLARGVDESSLRSLLDHVEHGDQTALDRMQVLPLARRWQVDEDKLIAACLHATRAGLLDLSFDVICPHCRGVREQAKTLGEVPARSSCEVCDIDFATDSENSVEVTFHVHPSVRDVPRVYYCSAEPSSKLHIFAQQHLSAGETRRCPLHLPPGRYRARLRGDKNYHLFDVADREPTTELVWPASGSLSAARIAPASELTLNNDTDADVGFVVERAQWTDDALRLARLLSNQNFRDLFSEEYLATDIQLSVGEQTVLFTDIVGSTRFYGIRGDPQAFMEVRRHFTELYEEVRRHNGAIVKTIGDAAMAAFTNPVDGLRAARDILCRFPPNREDTEIRLRASVHTGPCIAVNLNAGIDYFGNTVNLAAKLQGLAEDGQIAFTKTLYDAPGVADFLREASADLVYLQLEHTAYDEPIPVVRWDVNHAR